MRNKKHRNDFNSGIDSRSLSDSSSVAGSDPKVEHQKLTMKVGKTAALKVKKTSKKAKWSIVSGKKNIRLTAKKKTSVKVKAVKAGKAKISCKIGKKKLVCKVTVYGPIPPCVIPTQSPTVTASDAPTQQPTQSPAVTASVTPTATVAPTSTPTQTPIVTPNYEIKTINTPGPVADYDCLQVEPAEYKSYFNGDEGVIGAPWCKEIKFLEPIFGETKLNRLLFPIPTKYQKRHWVNSIFRKNKTEVLWHGIRIRTMMENMK